MRKGIKQRKSFKKTLAFCVIIAIFATILHFNGANAEDIQTYDATVSVEKVEGNKYKATVTFNQIDVSEAIVDGWDNLDGNKFTKTFEYIDGHTETFSFKVTRTTNDGTTTIKETAKVLIPYDLDMADTILHTPDLFENANYTIDDESIVRFKTFDNDTNKYLEPLAVGTTTLRGTVNGENLSWPINVTNSGSSNPVEPTETTVFADVNVGEKSSSGYPVTVTFNTVDSFNTSDNFVQSWIDNGWNVNGNKLTKTFPVDGDTTSHQAYLSCTSSSNNGNTVTHEIARVAIPYDIDIASNIHPGIASSVSDVSIADERVATITTESDGKYIKPIGVGNTTMTGKFRGYDYTWPINVANSSNPSDDPGTNPSDNPGTNPGDNPGTNPSDNPGTNPSDNPGTNPSDNPGTNPSDNPGTNPSDNPGTNPSDNPGTNPSDNPGTNPIDNPGTNPSDNLGTDTNSSNTTTETNTSTTGSVKLKEDRTVATKKLSKTGENNLYIFVMVGLVFIAIRAYIKDSKERKKC